MKKRMDHISSAIHTVRNRPLPKEPLAFFQYKQGTRLFVTITDTPSVWQDDLVIGEKLFADMFVCPLGSSTACADHVYVMEQTRDILKQRMRYPGVKENPEFEKIAKTWILPNKLNLGPSANDMLALPENSAIDTFKSIFTQVNSEDSVVHILKIEVADGVERQLLYKILDNGLRPSLILVKWSNDLDDHVPTASCAGHVMNCGYSLIGLNDGYALYFFNDQGLYDICSMKTINLKNPIMETLLQSVSVFQSALAPVSTIV
jgi:hypothetical protein